MDIKRCNGSWLYYSNKKDQGKDVAEGFRDKSELETRQVTRSL